MIILSAFQWNTYFKSTLAVDCWGIDHDDFVESIADLSVWVGCWQCWLWCLHDNCENTGPDDAEISVTW